MHVDGRLLTISTFGPEAAGLADDPGSGPIACSAPELGRPVKNRNKAEVVPAADPASITINGFEAGSVAIAADGQVQDICAGFNGEE